MNNKILNEQKNTNLILGVIENGSTDKNFIIQIRHKLIKYFSSYFSQADVFVITDGLTFKVGIQKPIKDNKKVRNISEKNMRDAVKYVSENCGTQLIYKERKIVK